MELLRSAEGMWYNDEFDYGKAGRDVNLWCWRLGEAPTVRELLCTIAYLLKTINAREGKDEGAAPEQSFTNVCFDS